MGLFCLSFHHIKTSYSNFSKVRFQNPVDFYKVTSGILTERVLIQTGTRVEVYGISDDPSGTMEKLVDIFAENSGLPREDIEGFFKGYYGHDAAEHLFRLVCCIESKVLGETYIPWQAEDGLGFTKRHRALGRGLTEMFQRVFRALIRARRETQIEGTDEPAKKALECLRRHIDDFHGKNLLLYGAGLTGRRVARGLQREGVFLEVLHRNQDIGERTAREVGGMAVEYSMGEEKVTGADILVCATLASHYRVTSDIIKEREKPLYVVDVSPFGNVDPGVSDIDGVVMIDGDVRRAVQENLALQEAAVPSVERIIQEEIRGLDIL